MMLALLLAAAPQLAAPGLSANGVPREKADAFNEYFAQQVSQRGVRVVTASEMSAVLGLERQKQLLGCSDGSECVAELAGALGVGALVTGSVSQLGSEWVVNLKVVASDGSRELAAYSTRAPDERAVLDFLAASAGDLAATLRPPSAGGPGRLWIGVAAGAGVLLAGGAVCTALSRLAESQLRDGGVATFSDAQAARARGELTQWLSLGLYAAGAAAAVAAAVLFGLSRGDVQASAAVVPGGAFGVIAFKLP